jgi:hypothetical protein
MFIELTDHLRCPEPHDEAFLVLLPDRMEGRRVAAGHLGCPICGWNTAWVDGVPVFGEAIASPADVGELPFDAAAILALLGLEGSGGWVALVGRVGVLGEDLAALLPDVGIAAINPPDSVTPSDRVSVIRSPSWPIKQHAVRGVVIGDDAAGWSAEALGSVLPGLRGAGEGAPPADAATHELVSETSGLWLARRR